VRIDVWSDFLCPFCHLGRRQLALALQEFEHADDVEVIWHSFQLDPNAPAVGEGSNVQRVADKYGVSLEQMEEQHRSMAEQAAAVGLDFQWDKIVPGNSYAAHRLHHYARSVGCEAEFMDRLMTGWYSEGAAIGDDETLVRLATEAGLEEAEVRAVLDSDDFGHEVRTDLALANQIGITSVPTFVLDQKYGVSGAQGVDSLLGAVKYAWDDQGNRPEAAGGGCGGGCCGGACGSGAADDVDQAGALATAGCGADGCGDGGCGGGGICGGHDEQATAQDAAHAH